MLIDPQNLSPWSLLIQAGFSWKDLRIAPKDRRITYRVVLEESITPLVLYIVIEQDKEDGENHGHDDADHNDHATVHASTPLTHHHLHTTVYTLHTIYYICTPTHIIFHLYTPLHTFTHLYKYLLWSILKQDCSQTIQGKGTKPKTSWDKTKILNIKELTCSYFV